MKVRHFYYKDDLVQQINYMKEYPLSQINAALNQLTENKHDYIVDKYNRTGNLINIDDLYLFQPLELKNKRISVHDRNRPIDYKHKQLKYPLEFNPGEVKESILKPKKSFKMTKEDANIIIDEIKLMYDTALHDDKFVRKGDNDWFKLASLMIDEVMSFGFEKYLITSSPAFDDLLFFKTKFKLSQFKHFL